MKDLAPDLQDVQRDLNSVKLLKILLNLQFHKKSNKLTYVQIEEARIDNLHKNHHFSPLLPRVFHCSASCESFAHIFQEMAS